MCISELSALLTLGTCVWVTKDPKRRQMMGSPWHSLSPPEWWPYFRDEDIDGGDGRWEGGHPLASRAYLGERILAKNLVSQPTGPVPSGAAPGPHP